MSLALKFVLQVTLPLIYEIFVYSVVPKYLILHSTLATKISWRAKGAHLQHLL